MTLQRRLVIAFAMAAALLVLPNGCGGGGGGSDSPPALTPMPAALAWDLANWDGAAWQ